MLRPASSDFLKAVIKRRDSHQTSRNYQTPKNEDSQPMINIQKTDPKAARLNLPLRAMRWIIYGEPLATQQYESNALRKLLALPVFCSDAISSVAYGPQQILLALTMAGLWLPGTSSAYGQSTMIISWVIFLVLVLVSVSYRQTIFGYPGGGGSYIVTKDNLGARWGLLAAAALLIDYVLCVSVSIASGLQNLRDMPLLAPLHIGENMVPYAVGAIIFMTWLNLRGLKEPGALFAIPVYTFIIMCYLMLAIGLIGPGFGWQMHLEFANQRVPEHVSTENFAAASVGMAVILRAFASGCSALTGVECVSNGIPAFKSPQPKNAAITLIWMATILGTIFLGISYLAVNLHIVYWEHQGTSAPAVIDQLSGAVFGKTGPASIFYNITQISTALILLVAAQTSYADFPRVASILARDGYMPRQLSNLGDRLAFDNGVMTLGFLSSLFIIAKRGSVDLLIPFFTIGVFQAFTLSQFGMVKHWFKEKGKGWGLKAILNGIGAIATLIVFIDILAEKFIEGAWFVMLLIGILLLIFNTISNHYKNLALSLALPDNIGPLPKIKTRVLALVQGVHAGTINTVLYAQSISPVCQAVYVEIEPEKTELFKMRWQEVFPEVELVVLPSPYRSLLQPLLAFVDNLEAEFPQDKVNVVIGEFSSERWWHTLLHGNSGLLLKVALLARPDIIVTNVRYKISESHSTKN